MCCCISIFERDLTRLLESVRACSLIADILEIRLDALYGPSFYLSHQHVQAIKETVSRGTTLLFTNRRKEEGGAFAGEEPQRLSWLKTAVDQGVDIIDIELDSDQHLRDTLVAHAKEIGAKVLISFHDFEKTPSAETLKGIFFKARSLGADIVKIVTIARSRKDLPRVIQLYQYAHEGGTPLIAFAMGSIGAITRVASLYLGAPFTFCAPPGRKGTAPGQLDIGTMNEILKLVPKSFS